MTIKFFVVISQYTPTLDDDMPRQLLRLLARETNLLMPTNGAQSFTQESRLTGEHLRLIKVTKSLATFHTPGLSFSSLFAIQLSLNQSENWQ